MLFLVSIKLRNKKLVYAGLIGASVSLLLFGIIVIVLLKQQSEYTKSLRAQYESRITVAEQQLKEQQAVSSKVVVATKELKAGSVISLSDLKLVHISKAGAPANTIPNPEDIVGKVIKIDVGKNTPIINSMVYANGATPKDLRSKEYNVLQLPTKLKTGDFVDVRIQFPNGQDYIVLSKKKVEDFAGTTTWYDINESELLAMSSAIVDAYLQGAKLYAINYVDPYMQDKAIPNYPLNLQVIDLIQSDPNVLEKATQQLSRTAREVLNKNLSEMSNEDKMKVANGISQFQVAPESDVVNSDSNTGTNSIDPTVTSTSSSDNSNQSVEPTTDPMSQPDPSQESVPQNEIVTPIETPNDATSIDQKQQDVFEQPLVK